MNEHRLRTKYRVRWMVGSSKHRIQYDFNRLYMYTVDEIMENNSNSQTSLRPSQSCQACLQYTSIKPFVSPATLVVSKLYKA